VTRRAGHHMKIEKFTHNIKWLSAFSGLLTEGDKTEHSIMF
jgi:hypothetical protein